MITLINFFEDYFVWHYTKGFQDLIKNIKTFFWFNKHFFAYSFLFKTLFSPFMRIKEEKLNIFKFESILSFVVVNGLMRFLGFLFRSIIILAGLFFWILTAILSIIVILIWLTFPVFIVVLLIDSFYIILK